MNAINSFSGLFLIGLLSISGLFADTAPPALKDGTLSAHEQRALAANEALISQGFREEAAQERIDGADALPDPQIGLTVFGESVQTRTGPQEEIFSVTQRFPWLGTRSTRRAGAKAMAEGAGWETELLRNRLLLETGWTYFERAWVMDQQRLTREHLAWLDRLAESVSERVRTGGDLNTQIRLQLEIESLRDDLAAQDRDQRVTEQHLRRLLALDPEQSLPDPEWAPPLPAALEQTDLQAAMRDTHPALKQARAGIAAAEAAERLARLAKRPDWVLGATYIQVGEAEMSVSNSGTDAWSVTAGISLPLWGDKNRSREAGAERELRAAEARLRALDRQLSTELEATLDRLRDAERRLALYEEQLLPLARQSVENSQNAFATGGLEFQGLIDAERSLLRIEQRALRAAVDAWRERLHLRALTGLPFHQIHPAPRL